VKILLVDFNAKIGAEDIFIQRSGIRDNIKLVTTTG